jgi:hypothetical protein
MSIIVQQYFLRTSTRVATNTLAYYPEGQSPVQKSFSPQAINAGWRHDTCHNDTQLNGTQHK